MQNKLIFWKYYYAIDIGRIEPDELTISYKLLIGAIVVVVFHFRTNLNERGQAIIFLNRYYCWMNYVRTLSTFLGRIKQNSPLEGN